MQRSPTATPKPVAPEAVAVRDADDGPYNSDGTQIGAFIWADDTADVLEMRELAFGPAPTPAMSAVRTIELTGVG